MRKFHAITRVIGVFAAILLFSGGIFAQSVIKGVIKDSTMPLEGASVVLEGKEYGVRTNTTGNFELKVGPGSYTVVISFVGYAPQKKNVTLTPGQTLSLNVVLEKDKALQAVTVVGTRSTTIRTNTQTATPVDVFSSKELQLTGQIEPTQMLNFVAPSFNSSRQTIADGTDHIDPATLRGLGPDQVLVLVNGMRRHNTALLNVNGTIGRGSVGTDLNTIPASAIERIEVLRDGAASQYGSDAIAGVVNIVLKKDYKKTNVNLHGGQYYEGDGATKGFSLNHGMRLGKKGYFDFFTDIRTREGTNRAGDFTGTVYYNIPGGASQSVRDSIIRLDNKVIGERGFSRKNNMQIGNSAVDNYAFMVNMGAPVTDRVNWAINAGINAREGKSAGFYRYAKQTNQVIAELYPDGFLPMIESSVNDNSVSAMVDGVTLNDIRWSVSNAYGSNSFGFEVENSNNASQFGLGRLAQTSFDAGKLQFTQNTSNLNLSKDFGKRMNLKSFNVALGGEFRIDNYKIIAGEEASYFNYAPNSGKVGGAQVFPGFQPANAVNETRYIGAGYLDIETDITDKLLVNAAGRYENYSDFGGNFAGKLSSRYKFSDYFTLRGTASRGFRAPSMHQRFFSAVSTVFISSGSALVPVQQGTFRNNSAVAAAFGIPSLKAETSTNYSIGATSKPFKNVSITVDAYQIDIKDRIVLTGSFTKSNPTVASILSGFPDINSAIFLTNAIDTRTQGIDVVINTTHKLGKGILDVTLAGNLNETTVVGNVRTTSKLPADSLNTNTLFSRDQRENIENGQPKNKFMLNLNYRIGNMNFMLRNTRFGEVSTKDRVNPLLDESFGAKIVTDASVSYRPVHWMNVTIGANNIGDVYPDRLRNIANTSEGRFVYSRNATQFGFNGGYYYTNLAFDLTSIKTYKKVKPAPVAPIVPVIPPEKLKDSDGDGVPDSKDACPNQPGPAIYDGCPDTDGDGVPDSKDSCPNVAGLKIFGGCPDTDGDGVEDAKDRCPNVFGVAKYYGCPVPDTDGDGVNDEMDKCPNEAGPASNSGCPVKETKEEVQVKVDKSAKNIFFKTGSATLSDKSDDALNDIVSILMKDNSLELVVEGHTDNVGGMVANQKLSAARAKSVKDYMLGKGVPENRVSTVGYSYSKPIASNATPEGREKNRRVVILIK